MQTNEKTKKEKICRIVHLYHDLMNLYGDWANPVVLAKELTSRGFEATVEKKSVGDDVNFDDYDFVYIGSGTERSQSACMRDLARHKDALLKRIEEGMHVLATGNAHELFGRSVTDASGKRFETLGLLDFETVQKDTRVTGDCVCKCSLMTDKLIGFINRAGGDQKGEIDRPFKSELGPGASAKKGETSKPRGEGISYKNLLGTYLTGPLLVRNPPLLRHIANKLTNQDGHESPKVDAINYREAAYKMALKELTEA